MIEETPVEPNNLPGGSVPPPMAPKVNVLAIIGLIAGILSIPLIFVCVGWLTAAAGLVLGIIGIIQINGSNGQQTGKGMAIGGIVTSVLAVIIYGIFIAWIATSEVGKGMPGLESAIEEAIQEAEARSATPEALPEPSEDPQN